MKTTITAIDYWHLKTLVNNEINLNGNHCDLNHIDVSQVTKMSDLFKDSKFNGDISKWDVSNVFGMDSMFEGSSFNGNISKWNVSKVVDMSCMFEKSKFNGDISDWDTSNVVTMMLMFRWSEFNQDISKWDVSNLINISYMFFESKFNRDLSDWTPYSLDMPGAPFSQSMAHVPYWATFDSYKERKQAIDKYKLNKELGDELSVSNKENKKIKI